MRFDQYTTKIPNKIGFYKDCRFNIKGGEQPPVEVLLIESEITMRCIRKDSIKGKFDSDRYYQLHHTCTTINAKNGRMERRYGSLFVKKIHYLVGSTSSDTILHLTGLQILLSMSSGTFIIHLRKISNYPIP
jgi:hypothetical protein